ncbi:MAG: peptidylprolyl isomerase [Gammaproteobacteria bacterium]|nr:peptidylprolyl isomerase [Gammaproteobacteria bacterium]
MSSTRRILAAMTVALLGAACSQKPAATAVADKPVATIDGKTISSNTFSQYVKGAASKPPEEITPEQRTQLLDNLVRAELVAQEAERNGTAARDETRALLDMARLQILQRAMAEQYLKDRPASDQELRAEYDLRIGQLPKLRYRASHILVGTEDAAKQLIEQLNKGASFAQLARANSTDPGSKDKGGDLDWFTPESMTPPFAEAVQKLKKGETAAAPVKTEFGWHVIRLVDTADNPPPPFESVKDRLGQMVQEKKFSAYVDTLLAKAKVTKTP